MGMPKIHNASFPMHVGANGAQTLWRYDISALLNSSPHFRLRNGSWSGGGEFFKVSYKTFHETQAYDWWKNGSHAVGVSAGCGNLATALPAVGTASSSAPNVSSIVSSFGKIDAQRESAKIDFTKGWNMTMPGKPEADLAQFIVELRDFPLIPGSQALRQLLGRSSPSVRRHKVSFFRNWLSGPVEAIPWKLQMQLGFFRSLGSEYLNHVFGWAPFVRDLQKLYVLSQTIDNRIKQIARDNNRGIRRKAVVRNQVDSSTTTQTSALTPYFGALYSPPNWGLNGKSEWTTTTSVTQRVWFSARYRYYIPDVGSGAWIPRARKALYGGIPTPSLVWELTPWSWLVDWFGNVGDVLANFSQNAVENLVADYAFCMVHTKAKTVSRSHSGWTGLPETGGTFRTHVPGGELTLTSQYETETKVRVLGTPYGLGVKWNDLSGRQLGVLAALGITKSKF